MPANKNQIRRIQTILSMMRMNRYPNYTSFLKEMAARDPANTYDKVSSKTFQRDIADLRDEYKAPIRYDASRRGFYLTNPDWYNEELMVEPFEMKAALLSERVASGILPAPLRSEISKAISALLMKNETGMAAGVELENFQIINPESLPQIPPEIFLACYNAWEQHKYLRLQYNSAQNAQAEKLFEPHVFAWNGGKWYLKGKLLRNNDVRYDDAPKVQTLVLHRIEKAEILNSTFSPDPQILNRLKENGLFDFAKIPVVEIEFFKPFAKPMLEKYAHTPGAIRQQSADAVTVRLKNIPEYEAAQLVLNACGCARIHTPPELRDHIRKIAQKILTQLDEQETP